MAGFRAGEGVLRRKPIHTIQDSEGAEGEQLTRTLGLWQLTAIGVGGIIGAGIFTLAGTIANGTAGPAVLISFLIAGIASAAAALSYAEFAGLIPKAGSAYTYGYAVLGELAGWFIGWDLLLEYTAIVAVVAIGISGYFSFLVESMGGDLPAWMLGAPGTGEGHKIDLFAVVLCLFIAYLLTLGMRSAARFEMVVVVLKVLVVLLVIAVGVFHIDTRNLAKTHLGQLRARDPGVPTLRGLVRAYVLAASVEVAPRHIVRPATVQVGRSWGVASLRQA